MNAAGSRGLEYRPDIDGLRALAVAAVVLYHAHAAWLPGGFAGVDVFFVVSGYLITGILLVGLDKPDYSLREFYSRRVARILPTLLLVLAATLVLAWLFMFSSEFLSTSKHVLMGSAFLTNVALWRETGYFDAAASTKPLLHLWSLAVEEQFYLVWPPLLAILYRLRPRAIVPAITVLAVASFAIVAVDQGFHTSADFYFPVTRLWELLGGALLGVHHHRRVTPVRLHRLETALPTVALICVGVSFVRPLGIAFWPSYGALLPVAGTMALIGSSPSGFVNGRFLAHRYLVNLGLISYPVYLWHWPLLTFTRLVIADAPLFSRIGATAAAIGSAVVLATLTYRFVERPARAHPTRRVITGLVIGLGAVGVLGAVGWNGGVAPRLESERTREVDAARTDLVAREIGAGKEEVAEGRGNDTVLMIGDSHMRQYWSRVQRVAEGGVQSHPVVLFVHVSCPLLPDVDLPGTAECSHFYAAAMLRAADAGIKTVVLSAYWDRPFLTDMYVIGAVSGGAPPRIGTPSGDSIFSRFSSNLAALRRSGKRVVLITSNPAHRAFDPTSMLPDRFTGRYVRFRNEVTRDSLLATAGPTIHELKRAARDAAIEVVDPFEYFCDARACPTVEQGTVPVYRDSHHLRASYVRRQATFIDSVLLIRSESIRRRGR